MELFQRDHFNKLEFQIEIDFIYPVNRSSREFYFARLSVNCRTYVTQSDYTKLRIPFRELFWSSLSYET